MARGKGKYGPKSKILVVLKSAHHKSLKWICFNLRLIKCEVFAVFAISIRKKNLPNHLPQTGVEPIILCSLHLHASTRVLKGDENDE